MGATTSTKIFPIAVEMVEVRITSRELDVLRALADGLSDKEIAQRLDLALRTVKQRIMYLKAKIGQIGQGRAALVAFAFRKGLLK